MFRPAHILLTLSAVGLLFAAGCQTETTIRRRETPKLTRVTADQLPRTPRTSPLAGQRQPRGEATGVRVMPPSSTRPKGAWGRFTAKVKRDWNRFTRSVEKAFD
jgi:hypothetical protein